MYLSGLPSRREYLACHMSGWAIISISFLIRRNISRRPPVWSKCPWLKTILSILERSMPSESALWTAEMLARCLSSIWRYRPPPRHLPPFAKKSSPPAVFSLNVVIRSLISPPSYVSLSYSQVNDTISIKSLLKNGSYTTPSIFG